MTKTEYGKCEKLMEEAIREVKQSEERYKEAKEYLKNANELKWEEAQRRADQQYGYAEGINQVLVILGFRHDRMKELSRLL